MLLCGWKCWLSSKNHCRSNMHRSPRNYYQICKVDHQRNQEQMVAEVERLHEAEKLVEKFLRNMNSSEKKDEISYRCVKNTNEGQLITAALRRKHRSLANPTTRGACRSNDPAPTTGNFPCPCLKPSDAS